jgi:hypothetical protein
MTHNLEYLYIRDLAEESERLNDTLPNLTQAQTDLSDWNNSNSDFSKLKSKSPPVISQATSKMQLKTHEDEYNFIDSFEKIHKQDINQVRLKEQMEKSLKQYTESKKLKDLNSSIRITVSPDSNMTTDTYPYTRSANQTPQAFAAVSAHYKKSLREFSGEGTKDNMLRIKNNARRIISNTMIFDRTLMNSRKKSRQKNANQLKRRLILVEKGIEELNRAAEYERTHQMSREVRERTKVLDMYISPRVESEERSASNDPVSRTRISVTTGFKLRMSQNHNLYYNMKH